MNESEEFTRQVDLVYKNLLDKFNPSARQLISAGKAYLKALHAAMASSKNYIEALSRIARQSQQSSWGGSSDIGSCLGQMVDVYREIQSQQMSILKAFYVDLLVPLENNLDRDTKVLQGEQKKFLATHKQRFESYNKASAMVRKQKKKGKPGKHMDKEIKHFQVLDEEKAKLDHFLSLSFEEAAKQERRRYGFILERQSSLAKHYLAYHSKGASLLQHHAHTWSSVAKTREELPAPCSDMLPPNIICKNEDGVYNCVNEKINENTPGNRRARSVEGSCNDLSCNSPENHNLTRAKSDFHLDQSHHSSLERLCHQSRFDLAHSPARNRKSFALPDEGGRPLLARALYPYHPSADNQLDFIESDVIAMIGDKNKGWQYGENLRTQKLGWYPIAYTDALHDEEDSALGSSNSYGRGRSESTKSVEGNKPLRTKSADTIKRSRSSSNSKIGTTRRSPSTTRVPSASTSSPIQHATTTTTSSIARTSDVNQILKSSNSFNDKEISNNSFSSANTLTYENQNQSFPNDSKTLHSTSISSPKTYILSCPHHTSSSSPSSTRTCRNCSFSSHDRIPLRLTRDVSFHSSDSGYSQDEYQQKDQHHYQSFQDLVGFDEEKSEKLSFLTWNDSSNVNPMSNFSEHEPLQYCSTNSNFRPNDLQAISELHGKKLNIDSELSQNKKKGLVSPCAQKIAAQREKNKNKKNGKRSLKRSSSLLCFDISSCRGVPKELLMADYEDVWSGEWEHASLVDIKTDIPAPPMCDPPTPPSHANSHTNSSYSNRPPMPLPHELNEKAEGYDIEINSSTSSGNSTLEGSWASGEEVYMVVNDNVKENHKSTANKKCNRKHVSRSLTWAPSEKKKMAKSDKIVDVESIKNDRNPPPPRPYKPKPFSDKSNNESPPLPPRKYQINKNGIPFEGGQLNTIDIFNYSDFLNKRLRLPEGTSRLDQRSYTTGNMCGPWYDFWGDDRIADVV